MNSLLLILCLSVNPISESEVNLIIDKLGSTDYRTRVKTTNELKFIGRSILKILRDRIEVEKDLEIKWRCQEVVDFYFRQCYQDILPIWLLPSSYRRLGGIDSAKRYYEIARDKFNEIKSNYFVKDSDYTDLNVSIKATTLFLKNLIESGVSNEDIAEIKKQMKTFDEILNNHADWYYNFRFAADVYTEDPPEEIETVISKINEAGGYEIITPLE